MNNMENFELPESAYTHKTTSWELGYLLYLHQANRINTNLDCQRGYVWLEDKQQAMIDTIMFGESIPEIHAIAEEADDIYYIADGKQRITTILKFLTDEIPWLRKYADEQFIALFGNKHSLKFSELPPSLQNSIKKRLLSIREYANMNINSTTKLFRKLNNGLSLSTFQKIIAQNISFKRYFLDGLMEHPVISKIFSDKRIENGKAEQSLMRILTLMDNYNKNVSCACDLRPEALFKYDFKLGEATAEDELNHIKKLAYYQDIVKKYLDRMNTFKLDNMTINADYVFLFTVFFMFRENLSNERAEKLYDELRSKTTASKIVGNGQDYSVSNVVKYIRYIDDMLKII